LKWTCPPLHSILFLGCICSRSSIFLGLCVIRHP
jgi:hypothetical protein